MLAFSDANEIGSILTEDKALLSIYIIMQMYDCLSHVHLDCACKFRVYSYLQPRLSIYLFLGISY